MTSLPLRSVLLNIICTLHCVMCTPHSSSTSLTSTMWRRCPNCWDTCAWIGCYPRTVYCLMESYRLVLTLYLVENSGQLLSRQCQWLRTTICSRWTGYKWCTPPRSPGCRWWDGRSGLKHFVKTTCTATVFLARKFDYKPADTRELLSFSAHHWFYN